MSIHPDALRIKEIMSGEDMDKVIQVYESIFEGTNAIMGSFRSRVEAAAPGATGSTLERLVREVVGSNGEYHQIVGSTTDDQMYEKYRADLVEHLPDVDVDALIGEAREQVIALTGDILQKFDRQ